LYYYRLRASSVMQELDSTKEKVMLDRVEYVTTRYARIAAHIPEIEEAFFLDALDTMTRYWYHSKQMPTAQKKIHVWAKKHIIRLLQSSMSFKRKCGYMIALFLKHPKICAEQAPILEEKDSLFE